MSILDNPPDQRKSSGSGSVRGYHVEARVPGGRDNSFVIADTTLTAAWRRINVKEGYPGIPISKVYHESALTLSGLVDYPCAQALRWWFISIAISLCKDVDTRIVEHEITWSWGAQPLEAFSEVSAEELMYPNKK